MHTHKFVTGNVLKNLIISRINKYGSFLFCLSLLLFFYELDIILITNDALLIFLTNFSSLALLTGSIILNFHGYEKYQYISFDSKILVILYSAHVKVYLG